jgi:hypothetical protein
MIPRLHVPLKAPEDVIPHLGKPTHYRQGRSAWCLANHWSAANEIPEPVRLTLETCSRFAGAELLEGFFEREVSLGDTGRPSQTDLLALLGIGGELVVMSVEGKVDEPFGKTVGEEAASASSRKAARIHKLVTLFGLTESEATDLRYQLFHRTAAAVFEAHRFRSKTAIMMVHSFDPAHAGSEDYRRFAEAVGIRGAGPTITAGPLTVSGVDLYLGWTADRPSSAGCSILGRCGGKNVAQPT